MKIPFLKRKDKAEAPILPNHPMEDALNYALTRKKVADRLFDRTKNRTGEKVIDIFIKDIQPNRGNNG